MSQAPNTSSGPADQAPIMQAIACGVTAPNPHNTQAWKFELVSDLEALLYVDERRLLPATDPLARQIHIGAGCCVEMLAAGMTRDGYGTDVAFLPDGAHGPDAIGQKPAARVTLRPGAVAGPDPLAEFIGKHQTNRKPYGGPMLDEAEAEALRGAAASADVEVVTMNQPAAMRPLLDIFDRAMEIEATTPHLWEETRIWFRFNEAQRRAHRDGLSVPQGGVDGLTRRVAEWVLRNGDPKRWFSDRFVRAQLKAYRKAIDSARGLVLLETRTNKQADWLEAGRRYSRLQLKLAQLGLTSHPYSQVLQEFPEMTDLQTEFNQLLGVRAPAKVQMAIRVGRAKRAYAAPRRPPEDFVAAGAVRA
jgi:hypothetical protein